jgi:hypothetical protein
LRPACENFKGRNGGLEVPPEAATTGQRLRCLRILAPPLYKGGSRWSSVFRGSCCTGRDARKRGGFRCGSPRFRPRPAQVRAVESAPRACSSGGQSRGLIIPWSLVRIQAGPLQINSLRSLWRERCRLCRICAEVLQVGSEMVRGQVRVSPHHLYALPTTKLLKYVQGRSTLNVPRSRRVPEVVPAEILDAGFRKSALLNSVCRAT